MRGSLRFHSATTDLLSNCGTSPRGKASTMSNFDAAGAPDAPSPSSLRLTELLIDEYVRRLSRPGRDGTWYRSFIADWLYFERPMMDRF